LGLEVAAAGASARPDAATPSAPHHAHRIVHASDSDDEIRCVIREIVAALRTTPAHRIAVLFATASPYARLLHEQLDAAGIAFNGPGPRPVHERALARGFLEIVTLDCVELPRADLFVALAEAPVRGFDGGQIPVSRWERVSRSAGIVGGHEWKQRLEALVESQEQLIASELAGRDPYQGRIDAARREIESARDLLAFVTAIRQRLEEGRALTTWLSLGEWAGRLLTDLYGTTADQARLPAEEQYAAAAVQRAVAGLAALGEFETEATVHGLGEAVAMELEAALPRVGRFGEGVFVGPVSSAIGLDADLVYVVGLAEDAYPGRMREDPLLPERVRRLTNGQLTATRERIGRRLRNLLAAFAAAPAVVACFPRGDLRRSTHRLPSRWLLPTFHELTGDQLLTATDWESASTSTITGSPSYAASLMATPQPANAQEWRVRAALADPSSQGDDAAVRAALALMRARGGVAFSRFDGNLAGQPGLPDFAAGTRRVSPTALESFAVCPHAYFVQRMLRVEPLEQPEQVVTISPLDVGNLVHASMDEFVKSCGTELPGYGQPWSAAQRARLRDIATNNAAKFERRGLTGHRVLWERELGLILGDIDTMLDDDDAWRAEHDARVLASELTFGRKGEPPVVIAVPSGNVAMVGSADKVDETRNGTLLVTDIKTGRAQSFKAIDDDPVVAGTKLQLPVYAYAARQLLGNLAGPGGHLDQVEAQYWFVRRDRGTRVSITLDQELEDTYAHAVGTLVTAIASGQFPAKAPEAPDFAWVQCNYCNPDGLGHGDVRERWERKRHAAELSELVSLIDPAALSVEAGNDG
ncbi:MAG: PD-(D/E)XK nuclease family protein, partial [Nocardioidaceae bacterium]